MYEIQWLQIFTTCIQCLWSVQGVHVVHVTHEKKWYYSFKLHTTRTCSLGHFEKKKHFWIETSPQRPTLLNFWTNETLLHLYMKFLTCLHFRGYRPFKKSHQIVSHTFILLQRKTPHSFLKQIAELLLFFFDQNCWASSSSIFIIISYLFNNIWIKVV